MKFILLIFSLVVICNNSHSDDLFTALHDLEEKIDKVSTTGVSGKQEASISSPGTVKVFTSKDIDKFDSLYELLRYVSGMVYAEEPMGDQLIYARNATDDTDNNKITILVNGHKFLMNHLGPTPSLNAIPKEAVKRIELIKGPGSVLYGSNAYSAMINIITFDGGGYEKNSVYTAIGTDQNIVFGTNIFQKSKHYNLFATFKTDARKTERGVPSFDQTMSSPEDYENRDLNKNLFLNYNRKHLHINIGKTNLHRKITYKPQSSWTELTSRDQTLPAIAAQVIGAGGTMAQAVAIANANANVTTSTVTTRRNDDALMLGAMYENDINDKLRYEARLTYSTTRNLYGLEGTYGDVNSKSHRFESELKLRYEPNQNISYLFGWQRKSNYARQSIIDFTHWNKLVGNVKGQPLLNDARYQENSFYLQSIFKLSSKLNMVLANRFNQHQQIGHVYTPKYALTWSFDSSTHIKFIYGKAFGWPSEFERYQNTLSFIANKNIQAEEMDSYEYNFSKKWDNDKKDLSVSHYRTQMKNGIGLSSSIANIGGVPRVLLTYKNDEVIDNNGIEIDYSEKYNAKFTGHYSATFMDSTVLSGEDRLDIVQSTNKLFSILFDYNANERWGFYTSSKYIGKQRENRVISAIPDYQTFVNGGHTIHNLGLVYSHNDNRKVRIDITNAFDKKYRYPWGIGFSWREPLFPPGRKVSVRYEIKF